MLVVMTMPELSGGVYTCDVEENYGTMSLLYHNHELRCP